ASRFTVVDRPRETARTMLQHRRRRSFRGDDLDTGRPPPLHFLDWGARVGNDARKVLDWHEREQRAAMPLRAVEDAENLLTGVGHLLLDPHLVRIQIHESALEAQAARTEKTLVDPSRAEDIRPEIADKRHR